MTIAEDRPLVRIGDITIDVYGHRTQPDIDVAGGQRTVKKSPLGTAPVVQYKGPKAKTVTITGECSFASANAIDDLDDESVVRVRSDRFTGQAVPDDTDTRPLGKINDDDGRPIYHFRVDLTEVLDASALQTPTR